MSDASRPAALHSSRLVRALARFADSPGQDTTHQFSHRLGTLIDLADSIKLASVQASLRELPFQPDVVGPAGIRREFMAGRAALIKAVLRACVPGSNGTQIRFPEVTREMPENEAVAPEPYLAFYKSQQGDIDHRARRLHKSIRRDVSGVAHNLTQLAALDAALATAMGQHLRRYFNSVPALLAVRWQREYDDYRRERGDAPYDYTLWQLRHDALRVEVQDLLLAEVEARLLPVLGLVEALENTTGK